MAGQLGWSPAEFWAATFAELYWMHRGWLIAQGVDPDKTADPLSRNELDALEKKLVR
ncbi:MAG: phage tail assembly chaperone [Emcibacter sp.]|nr:phage tail assembly chaperone [Emcibacter sp.]